MNPTCAALSLEFDKYIIIFNFHITMCFRFPPLFIYFILFNFISTFMTNRLREDFLYSIQEENVITINVLFIWFVENYLNNWLTINDINWLGCVGLMWEGLTFFERAVNFRELWWEFGERKIELLRWFWIKWQNGDFVRIEKEREYERERESESMRIEKEREWERDIFFLLWVNNRNL